MARRRDLGPEIVDLIGPAATLVDVGSGWPSIIDLTLEEGGKSRIAAHMGPVHAMGRRGSEPLESRPEELRFQNPGKDTPPQAPAGTTPLLIGLLPSIGDDPPALVISDNPRLGLATRFTVRFPGGLAYEGARSGWATYSSTSGERFWAISPRLLPTLVLVLQESLELPISEVRASAQAAGPLTADDGETKERARVATSRLARNATFRKRVLSHYGATCAFCGLSVDSLLQAAHLFPINLPGSSDSPSNGIVLCLHHHALLDGHRLYVDPATLGVQLDPALEVEENDPALEALIATTRTVLSVPTGIDKQEVSAWLDKRYDSYPDAYPWIA